MGQRIHFPWLTSLRGFAMCLVIWSHLCIWFLYDRQITSQLQIVWDKYICIPLHLYQSAGHLGVLVFFLVSGWVITHVSLYETRTEFMIKRIFRIFPSLLLSLVVMAAINWISGFFEMPSILGHESDKWIDYIWGLLLVNYFMNTPAVLTVTWTLTIECLFYFLTFVFMSYTVNKPLKATLMMIGSTSLLVLLWCWQYPTFIVFILYILLGRIFYLSVMKKITLSEGIVLSAFNALLFVCLYSWITPDKNFPKLNQVIYSDVWGIVLFFLAMIVVKKVNRIEEFLGKISYSAYLLHLPVGSIILNSFLTVGIDFKFALICAIGGTFLVSYLFFNFIEAPIQRFARKIIINLQK